MRGTLALLALAAALSFEATAMAQGTTSVTLGWTPSSSPAVAGYYIYYGTDTNSNDWTVVPVLGANASSITINGLTSGQTYYFAAASFDNSYNFGTTSPTISDVAGAVAQAAGVLSAVTGLPTGQFGFAMSGVAGARYIVQASTDLVHWVTLQTNTAPFQFVDSNATKFARRFYRTGYLSN
ncbi:MAG: fibronectin type III domain-containing protein [Limisphaerales bacterium]